MDNRIIGSLLVYFSLLGTITYALFFEGLPGKYSHFISWPSFLVVFGGGTGMILMRKHTYQDNQLGKNLKREFILAGWIGFMIGLVLLGVAMNGEGGQDNVGRGFAASLLTVLYGYISGNIAKSFLAKNTDT